MYIIYRKLFLLITPIVLLSCIRDNNDDCGVYLQFIFDYNMEYADSFNPQVNHVDVFIFDEEGKIVTRLYSESSELVNQNQMYLTDNLAYGNYKIFTVGGMSELTRISTKNGNGDAGTVLLDDDLIMEDLIVFLQRESQDIYDEIPHFWMGQPIDIKYEFNRAVYPVSLVRNTNRFNLMLQEIDIEEIKTPDIPPFTFKIVSPDGAVYNYENTPILQETVNYHPWSLTMVDQPENTTVGRINTMRLLVADGFRLEISETETDQFVWGCDLIDLLKNTKPQNRPDGSELPLQEYLDRQGEWNIEVLYRDIIGGTNGGFLAVAISVNGWILWLNDIGI